MDSLKNKIFVYKTTNKINGMIYIGVHKCRHPGICGYLGSGKALRRAVDKHGRESFSRKILFFFDSLEEAFAKEKELVSIDFINDKMNYNLVEGGKWGKLSDEVEFLRRLKISQSSRNRSVSDISKQKIRSTLLGHTVSTETREKISKANTGKVLTESHKKNISIASKIRTKNRVDQVMKMIESNKCSKRSNETKQKMRDAWALRKITNDNN